MIVPWYQKDKAFVLSVYPEARWMLTGIWKSNKSEPPLYETNWGCGNLGEHAAWAGAKAVIEKEMLKMLEL